MKIVANGISGKRARSLFFLGMVLLGWCLPAKATTCTAIINGGAWSSSGTWSCGVVPGNNDTMIIPVGFTVSVDINSPTYSNMLVIVNGILDFGNGQKLNICPGGVYVSGTGELSGGTPGSKINICGTTVWNGPGPTRGPISFGTTPLPVELLSFSAILQNDGTVKAEWTTATESNNDFFTLERSTDGMSFSAISRVDGAGNSTQPHSYTTSDPAPAGGVNYYRLRQTDFNGQTETFNIVAVEVTKSGKETGRLHLYPNPCTSECFISLEGSAAAMPEGFAVELLDMTGRVIYSAVPAINENGVAELHLNAGNYKPGVYMIRGVSHDTVYQEKLIIR